MGKNFWDEEELVGFEGVGTKFGKCARNRATKSRFKHDIRHQTKLKAPPHFVCKLCMHGIVEVCMQATFYENI